MHEAAVVAAIAEAQRDAAAAHEAWAEAEAEAGWAAGRASLFAAGGGAPTAPTAGLLTSAAGLPLPAPIPRSPAGGAALPPRARAYVGVVARLNEAAAAAGGGGGGGGGAGAPPSLDAVSAFADAAAAAAGDAAAAAATAGGPPPDPAAGGIAELWAILRRQAVEVAAAAAGGGGGGDGGAPSTTPSQLTPAACAAAALAGSRAHLEAQFAAHMDTTIRHHRAAAALGGAPGREGRVKAFIRVRDPEAAPFDFDSGAAVDGSGGSASGSDTTWQRVWLCLRAGWVGEAGAAAAGAPDDAVLPCGSPLSAAIAAWGAAVAAPSSRASAASAPAPPPSSSQPPPPLSALVAEAERLLRSGDRAAWSRPAFRHRVAVHALLAGDARCVRAVLAGAPTLCGTVEDWVWFQAAAAGRATAAGGAAAGSAGAAPPAPTPPGAATLAALQASAARPGPAHYGGRAGGGAPWRYAAVLLLTVQPRAAIAFAARHPAGRGPLRGEAAHLALAATAAGLWCAGGAGDAGHPACAGTADGGPPPATGGPPPSSASEPAPLLRASGRALARPEPAAALEYYVAAARFGSAHVAGGGPPDPAASLALRAALLRELLTESGAVGGLLGTGGGGGGGGSAGVGGPLARFAPDPADRASLVRAVAAACEAGGQGDWAAELFAYGGAPGSALRLICGALAGVVEAAAAGGPGSDASSAADRLVRRGNAAAEGVMTSGGGSGGSGGGEASAALDLFASLKAVRALLDAARAGDPGGVLRAASALPFLPADAFRLGRCVDAAAALPEPLAERLSTVVPAVAAAASEAGDADRVRVLATFAGSLPQRVSRAAFERCVALHDKLQ